MATSAITTARARAASVSTLTEIADEFIVDAADGPDGAFRPILDSAGEPERYPTLDCAIDVAEAWFVQTNCDTRIRSHRTGEVIDTEPTDDELDAMWLAAKRAEWEAEDYAAYERYRARAQRPILERATEDAAKYGEAA